MFKGLLILLLLFISCDDMVDLRTMLGILNAVPTSFAEYYVYPDSLYVAELDKKGFDVLTRVLVSVDSTGKQVVICQMLVQQSIEGTFTDVMGSFTIKDNDDAVLGRVTSAFYYWRSGNEIMVWDHINQSGSFSKQSVFEVPSTGRWETHLKVK